MHLRQEAIFLNVVYEAVLRDILLIQEHLPEHVMYLQPYSAETVEAVPHRQFVFTLPKRLRAHCLRSRPLLGELAREAAHTTIRFVRATLDEPELSVGVVLSIQMHGSLVNWNPPLGDRSRACGNGRFLKLPFHDAQVLAEAFRRADGHYSNRQRARRRGSAGCAQGLVAVEQPRDLCRRQARLQWAELLQRVFEIAPLECRRCGASMRILAFIQERAVTPRPWGPAASGPATAGAAMLGPARGRTGRRPVAPRWPEPTTPPVPHPSLSPRWPLVS